MAEQFTVVEIRGTDGALSPDEYPRALYYDDYGGLVLFPPDKKGHALRMDVDNLAETDDGRVVAVGKLGTMLVLERRAKKRRRKSLIA